MKSNVAFKTWLYFIRVAVLATMASGGAWSVSRAGMTPSRAESADSPKLIPIENGSRAPGALVPNSPQLPTEEQLAAARAAVPPEIPSQPRRLSVLVHMEPVAARGSAPRANLGAFAEDSGGEVHYEYKVAMPNVLNLRDIPENELEALKNLPGVEWVEMDEYHPNVIRLHDSTPLIRALQSQVTGAGFSVDGRGVRICIVDTGIDTDHLMYSSRIDLAASWDFHNNDPNPEDDHGHGSHVAGIAAGGTGLSVDFGCGAGSQAFQGVAPGATLVAVKVLNSAGGGFDSNIIAGIDHCADQSASGGRADVINMSIGTGNFTSGACTHSWAVAANNAAAAGVLPIAASGNENNSNSMGSPACGADVIAVGATWKADYPTCEDNTTNWNWGSCTDFSPKADDVVCFSNESDFLDVTAPGANIWSASNAAGGGSITGMSGTSMASPQVAGLAALVMDLDPSLTQAEVRQIIRDGAIDMGPVGFDRAYGWGRIDVLDTLALVGGGCTSDGECDDGLFCNGAETCDIPSGNCQAGTPPNCNDGVACTDDSCNEGTASCDNTPNNANCPDDALFCNGIESCDPVFDCVSSGDPCPGGSTCNETTDTCAGVECVDAGDCDDGSACTSDSCVANVCVNDCGGTISSFPYSEDFEAGLGAWSNVGGDVFDWTRDSAGTPSSNTGPSGDHTTGSGFYMYTETSSPRVQGDTAILEGPCFDLTVSSNVDLSFWYHMFGASMGTLDVDVSNDCTVWTNVWTLSGDQGNTWFPASVNLDAYAGSVIKVRFVGTRGSSWRGDIAIDDISVVAVGTPCTSDPECDDGDACTTDSCVSNLCRNRPINCDDGNGCTTDTCSGGVCSSTCPAIVSSFPDTEDYEAGFGDWSNVVGDNIDWTRNSGGTPSSGTGPTGDHTTGSGWYVYIEASSPNYPSMTAILEGPCVDLTGSSSANLSFWYHMLGSAVGTLFVEASDDCSTWVTEWSLTGDQGSAWQQASVDLSAWSGSIISIRFRGVTGSSWQGDICIDDLEIDATGGPECVVPADCDDGLFCNGAEDCVAGSCVAGTPPNCNDDVGCTDDTCNEVRNSCDNTANDANCDNGLFCDGAETCNATLDCQGGSAPNCNDGVGCTDDSCNETTDSCDNIANNANCPDDGLFCNGAEFCDAVNDCSSTGDPCAGGEVCNETTDTCDPGGGARLESGTVMAGAIPIRVLLTNTYTSPVVVCSIQYSNNTIPVVTRVTNVTATTFDLYLQGAAVGGILDENVSCLVVEEGVWTIDGVNIEAQTYLSTVTDENNSWVGQAQTYLQNYTNPVVVGQVMSDNDAEWSVFWDQGSARTAPPSATTLRTGKTVCEDTLTARANETIGFIVIEAGHGTLGGVEFEAALGADTVRGVTNAPPYTYTFNTAFAATPTIGIVTMAAVDGVNGGWAYTFGAAPMSTTSLDLVIDEDQIGDTERNHTTEQVGYIVFAGPAVSP